MLVVSTYIIFTPMPILTPEQIATLQTNIREAIMDANPDQALALLEDALPANRAKHNQVVLLKSRQSDIVQHTVNNTLSETQLEVMRNNLTSDILLFIDHLIVPDFLQQPAQRPGLKPGHLLYQVPAIMVLQNTYDCLVRVAEELSQVMEGIAEEEDIVVEDIGLSEVMEVEILDAGGTSNPAFDIMLLSDGEQVVDAYSYTEWVFNVRPIREGQHQLILKISVLLTIKGKERTKNVILRRPISVAAKVIKDAPPAQLRRVVALQDEKTAVPLAEETVDTGQFEPPMPPLIMVKELGSKAEAAVPKTTPTKPPTRRPEIRRKSKRSSFTSLAATLLFLVFAGIWLVTSDGMDGLFQKEAPDVGTTKPDPITLPPVTTDTLQAPKRLLPDSLKND
jgi:hypothetical protein